MLCLELMTGERPYHHLARDIFVAMEIKDGLLPERPGEPAISNGLTDGLWDIMLQCWHRTPSERPSMTRIKEMLRSLPHAPAPSSGRSLCLYCERDLS
jgi:son of sevenless-like protein